MELNNEGVVNLMIALTERAYADYVLAGIRLKDCEYEIQDGVIHVLSIHGRPVKDKWEQNRVDRAAQLYNTARMFFEGTKWGEYLMRKGNEEIAMNERSRKTRHYETGQTKKRKELGNDNF